MFVYVFVTAILGLVVFKAVVIL